MAKVHSIFEINGKLGDYVFYKLNGKKVMRKVGAKKRGPKSEGLKRNALQNSEFGKASTAGKFLRTALKEECQRLNDRYLYWRVTQLMLRLKAADGAEPGLRTAGGGLCTPKGLVLMRDFRFHKKYGSFPKLLSADRQGGTAVLHLSPSLISVGGITELQINLNNGHFRKHVHPVPETSAPNRMEVSLNFRRKKDFTELLLIWGDGFLQGVVVQEE